MKYVTNTAYDQCLKPFLLAVTAKILQLLKLVIMKVDHDDRDHAYVDDHGLDDRDDPEVATQVAEPAAYRDRRKKKYNNNNLDWAKIIVVFCLTAGIGFALLPLQLHDSHLPIPFYFLGLAVLLAFTCILVSKFIHFNYSPAGISIPHLFHNFGLFFGFTAFFISITIPFPLWFRCTAYSIYAAACIVIALSNLHCDKYYNPRNSEYPNPKNFKNNVVVDPAVESSCRSGTNNCTAEDQACINIV